MATPNLLSGLTTVTPKILASAQMASGETAAYTVPANKAAKVATCTITNVSASVVVISVSVVASGGTADGTHRVISAYSLVAGDSLLVADFDGMWLGAGDFISVNAAAATAIDVIVTGLEFA
jgi:hypothetical protein